MSGESSTSIDFESNSSSSPSSSSPPNSLSPFDSGSLTSSFDVNESYGVRTDEEISRLFGERTQSISDRNGLSSNLPVKLLAKRAKQLLKKITQHHQSKPDTSDNTNNSKDEEDGDDNEQKQHSHSNQSSDNEYDDDDDDELTDHHHYVHSSNSTIDKDQHGLHHRLDPHIEIHSHIPATPTTSNKTPSSSSTDNAPRPVRRQQSIILSNEDEPALDSKFTFSHVGSSIMNVIPAVKWIKNYNIKEYLMCDLIAGLTSAIVLLPQGIAYALLAGLPPEYGLYTCLAPPLVYCLLGTSKEMQVGPFSLVSIMVFIAIGSMGVDMNNPDEVVSTALSMSIMVGLILGSLCLCRFGFVVSFLAEPVIVAFNSASALLIITSQIKSWLGLTMISSSSDFIDVIIAVFKNFNSIHLPSFLLGLFCLCSLYAIEYLSDKLREAKKLKVPLPAALFVMIIATIIVYFSQHTGVAILGHIPTGLPKPILPSMNNFASLLRASFLVALISYVTGMSVCKHYATKQGTEVNANQELLALSVANLLGGFFQAYPSTGSLSRSSILDSCSVKTPLHNVISAFSIILSLLFLTPILSYLPKPCLAAVIISSLRSLLFRMGEGSQFYSTSKEDFVLWLCTLLCTIFLGLQTGIALGVLFSLIILIKGSSIPAVAVLGKLPNTKYFRNIRRFPLAQQIPGILIFRFDAPLHFANRDFFRNKLISLVHSHQNNLSYYSMRLQQLELQLSKQSYNSNKSTPMHSFNRILDNNNNNDQNDFSDDIDNTVPLYETIQSGMKEMRNTSIDTALHNSNADTIRSNNSSNSHKLNLAVNQDDLFIHDQPSPSPNVPNLPLSTSMPNLNLVISEPSSPLSNSSTLLYANRISSPSESPHSDSDISHQTSTVKTHNFKSEIKKPRFDNDYSHQEIQHSHTKPSFLAVGSSNDLSLDVLDNLSSLYNRGKLLVSYYHYHSTPLHTVILECSCISSIDASALQMLSRLSSYLNGIDIIFCSMKSVLRDKLHHTYFSEKHYLHMNDSTGNITKVTFSDIEHALSYTQRKRKKIQKLEKQKAFMKKIQLEQQQKMEQELQNINKQQHHQDQDHNPFLDEINNNDSNVTESIKFTSFVGATNTDALHDKADSDHEDV